MLQTTHRKQTGPKVTSTPHPGSGQIFTQMESSISEISAEEISGVEEIESSSDNVTVLRKRKLTAERETPLGSKAKKVRSEGVTEKTIQASFSGDQKHGDSRKGMHMRMKFDTALTDEELEQGNKGIDPDDPTFQPSEWDITLLSSDEDLKNTEEEVDITQEVHDLAIEKQPGDDRKDLPASKLKTVTSDIIDEPKYIVSKTSLEKLVGRLNVKCDRKNCRKAAKATYKEDGSSVTVKWVCEKDHEVSRWSSQPVLPNGVFLGNFQASAAVILSGNNYTKVALFAKFLNLKFPSSSSFQRVQSKYVVPVVDSYWINLRDSSLEEHRAVDIIVSGDGRMDSPGHSAKYCTYTVMNQSDKRILAMEVVDKRETNLKSGLMEAEGFRRAMVAIRQSGTSIKEVVTDAHPQISSIMKKNFPEIRHSYDMWHGAKNFGKKLCGVANTKGNDKLKGWLGDIGNHFFHSAETCEGKVQLMKNKWLGLLNHVVNRHSWALGKCDHGQISDEDRDKEWLTAQSSTWRSLEKVVREPRFLRSFHYYVTCQSTFELENFNNHLLMYAPKRNAFSYVVYKCRCQLAAIDYMEHLEREHLTSSDGSKRYRRSYSKGSKHWTVIPVKTPKEYKYITCLMTKIVNKYCEEYEERPLRGKTEPSKEDPVNIMKTIAAVEPPPTKEIVEKLKRRIKSKEEKG